MKKVLVTGGTGFIGSNIVKSLIKKYQVSVYDNNSRGELINLNEYKGSFNFIEGDIRDKINLLIAVKTSILYSILPTSMVQRISIQNLMKY